MGKMYSSMVNSGVDEIEFTTLYPKIPEDTWRVLNPLFGVSTLTQSRLKRASRTWSSTQLHGWLSRPRADGWPDPNLTNGDVQFFKKDGKKSATNRCLWKWVVPWYPKKLTFMVEKYVRNMDFRQIPMTMCARSVFPIYLGTKIWVMGQQVNISCFRRPGAVSSLRSSQPRGDFDIKKSGWGIVEIGRSSSVLSESCTPLRSGTWVKGPQLQQRTQRSNMIKHVSVRVKTRWDPRSTLSEMPRTKKKWTPWAWRTIRCQAQVNGHSLPAVHQTSPSVDGSDFGKCPICHTSCRSAPNTPHIRFKIEQIKGGKTVPSGNHLPHCCESPPFLLDETPNNLEILSFTWRIILVS